MDASIVLDSSIRRFVDDLAVHNVQPVYTLTPARARHMLVEAQSVRLQQIDADVEDRAVDLAREVVRLRITRSKSAATRAPVILYFHGGGWVVGDAQTHDRMARDLATRSAATVILVEYDRAPERRFPVAIEQGYRALEYVLEHEDELRVDSSRIVLAGDSSGGNIATVVSLLANQRAGPHIRGQALFYPAVDATFATLSYQQFACGPWLTRRAMEWFWEQYLYHSTDRGDPLVSPLRAPLDQLSGLPATLIITAENDVLRDEGEAYARRLIQAGVPVVATRYQGVIHDFMLLNAIADAVPVRAALDQAGNFIRRLLQ